MAIRRPTESTNAATRSGPPKGELEQYGIWVKAEPQDILEEATQPAVDLETAAEMSPVSEESFLSPDEERLLGSFDADFDAPAGSPSPTQEEDLSALPSIDDIPALEESLFDSTPPLSAETGDTFESGPIDISLDDDVGTKPTIVRGDIGRPGAGEQTQMPSPEMEDVSAEFMDMTPSDSGSASEDVTSDFLDVEGPEPPRPQPAPGGKTEFDSLDIDLHFDDTIPHPEDDSQKAASLPGFESVTEFDDFLAPADGGAEPQREPAHFDDVAAVERDLAGEAAPAKPVAQARAPAAAQAPDTASRDLSNEILLKIAAELASIRGELVSLKTQLVEINREAEPAAEIEPAPSFEKEEEGAPAGGFFDEEEDETIALTGDELDNILNTADFTEEAAQAESLEGAAPESLEDLSALSIPTEPSDTSLLSESILPETGDYSAPPAAESGAPDFAGIEVLAAEGAHPITEAPEDTSYLEAVEPRAGLGKRESGAAPGELDAGDVSLSDVPLVEPDLSAFDVEELETADIGVEPISEIEEEMPIAEEVEALPDVELSLDQVADVEELETESEIDHSHLGGISLHEEESAEVIPELEELVGVDEEPAAGDFTNLAEEIDRNTVKPAQPVALHPDEIPTSLDDTLFVEESPRTPAQAAAPSAPAADNDRLKTEIRSVLSYLDKLLDYLPEDKIEEFAHSEHFDTYKKLFEELGLV